MERDRQMEAEMRALRQETAPLEREIASLKRDLMWDRLDIDKELTWMYNDDHIADLDYEVFSLKQELYELNARELFGQQDAQ